MDEQDKKPLDADGISDEDLEEIVGGILRSPEEQKALFQRMREARQRFMEEGGKPGEFHFMVTKALGPGNRGR